MDGPTTRCGELGTSAWRVPGGLGMIVPGVVLLFLFVLPPAIGAQDAIETIFWESVECESRLQVQAYLETYPQGVYVAEARACLERQLGLDRAARILVQQGLASLDYEVGAVDGLFGPATRAALRQWQRGKGFAATGFLTREQAGTLMAQGRDAVATAQREQAEADQSAREAAARAEATRRAQEAEDTAYAEAQQLDTAASYGAYLMAYPTGRHAVEARIRQQARAETERLAQEAAAREADEAAYAEAQRIDTATAYGEYLAAYPTGRHAAEARARQQARAETERLAQLPREIRNSLGMELVLIEAGTFEMGSPATEPGRDDDETLHSVTISQPFYLGKYEVTQAQWQAVMGNNPSYFSDCGGTCPVEEVSWEDAQEFVAALNRQEGVTVYRLPTEAEVGVCGAGRDADGVSFWERGEQFGALCLVRCSILWGLGNPSGGTQAAEWVGAARCVWERVGVGS